MNPPLPSASRTAPVSRPVARRLGPPLLALGGFLLLLVFARGNRASAWLPVRLPLAGPGSVSGEFVPEAGRVYEVEIEIRDPAHAGLAADRDAKAAVDWIYAAAHPPGAPGWEIRVGAEAVVTGDAREAAYLEVRLPTWRGRLRDALLFAPFQRDAESRRTFGLRGGGTLSRGLGYFRARSAASHRVTVAPGPPAALVSGTEPTFNVRRSRPDWIRHQRRTLPLAVAGYAGLLGGPVWWLFLRRGKPGLPTAPGEAPGEGGA